MTNNGILYLLYSIFAYLFTYLSNNWQKKPNPVRKWDVLMQDSQYI